MFTISVVHTPSRLSTQNNLTQHAIQLAYTARPCNPYNERIAPPSSALPYTNIQRNVRFSTSLRHQTLRRIRPHVDNILVYLPVSARQPPPPAPPAPVPYAARVIILQTQSAQTTTVSHSQRLMLNRVANSCTFSQRTYMSYVIRVPLLAREHFVENVARGKIPNRDRVRCSCCSLSRLVPCLASAQESFDTGRGILTRCNSTLARRRVFWLCDRIGGEKPHRPSETL